MTAIKSPCNGLVVCPWDENGRTEILVNNKVTVLQSTPHDNQVHGYFVR